MTKTKKRKVIVLKFRKVRRHLPQKGKTIDIVSFRLKLIHSGVKVIH